MSEFWPGSLSGMPKLVLAVTPEPETTIHGAREGARTGLRTKIEREMDRIGRAIGRLSYKQQACLAELLSQAYRMRGITEGDWASWHLPPPALSELS
jgi:hypothetical protein